MTEALALPAWPFCQEDLEASSPAGSLVCPCLIFRPSSLTPSTTGSASARSPSLHTVLPALISVVSAATGPQGCQRNRTLRGAVRRPRAGEGTAEEGGRPPGLQRQQEVYRKSQAPRRSRFHLGSGPDRGGCWDRPRPPHTVPRPPLQDTHLCRGLPEWLAPPARRELLRGRLPGSGVEELQCFKSLGHSLSMSLGCTPHLPPQAMDSRLYFLLLRKGGGTLSHLHHQAVCRGKRVQGTCEVGK